MDHSYGEIRIDLRFAFLAVQSDLNPSRNCTELKYIPFHCEICHSTEVKHALTFVSLGL